MNYTTHKRFKAKGIDGGFNIPFGAELECQGGFLCYDGKRVCRAESENGYEHFHPDTPEGNSRYAMVTALADYYRQGENIDDVYYREFEPQENDYWLHILRTMDTARLTALCFKRLGGIPCTK